MSYSLSPNELFSILRKKFPDVTIPEDWEGGDPLRQKWNNRATTALIGGAWVSLEKSVVDTA